MFFIKGSNNLVEFKKGIEKSLYYNPVHPCIVPQLGIVRLRFFKKVRRFHQRPSDVCTEAATIDRVQYSGTPRLNFVGDGIVALYAKNLGDVQYGSLDVAFHSMQVMGVVLSLITFRCHMSHEVIKRVSVLVPHLNRQFLTASLVHCHKITCNIVQKD